MHKVAQLLTMGIAAVLSKELDLIFSHELVKLVIRHTGHTALVLFFRAINIEVPKTHYLVRCFFKMRPQLAPHFLVKQQLGVTVHIQRLLVGGFLFEGG